MFSGELEEVACECMYKGACIGIRKCMSGVKAQASEFDLDLSHDRVPCRDPRL